MLKQTILGAAALGIAVLAPLTMGAAPAQANSLAIEIGHRWDRGHHHRHRYHGHHYNRHHHYTKRYKHHHRYDRRSKYRGHYHHRRWW